MGSHVKKIWGQGWHKGLLPDPRWPPFVAGSAEVVIIPLSRSFNPLVPLIRLQLTNVCIYRLNLLTYELLVVVR